MTDDLKRVRPDEVVGRRLELPEVGVVTVLDAWKSPAAYTFFGRWYVRAELPDGPLRTIDVGDELPEPIKEETP